MGIPLNPAEKAHIETFNTEVRKIGHRMGKFLHQCIDEGVDVEHPGGPAHLSLSPYELGFVLELIEQHLQNEGEKALMDQLRALNPQLTK